MKTTLIFLSVFLSVNFFGQYTQIPDSNFEQALINLGYDDVIDGQILTDSINSISILEIADMEISNLSGIEGFSSLTELYCEYNELS